MKRIFTVLFTLFATAIWAQSLQLTVSITDTAGNPSDGIEVFVVDSISGFFAYGVTDDDGNALFEFDNVIPGSEVIAIAFNCQGVPVGGSYTYQGGQMEQGTISLVCQPFQLPDCGVHIEHLFDPAGGDLLEAAAFELLHFHMHGVQEKLHNRLLPQIPEFTA